MGGGWDCGTRDPNTWEAMEGGVINAYINLGQTHSLINYRG